MKPPSSSDASAVPDIANEVASVPLAIRLARAFADVASIVLAFVTSFGIYNLAIEADFLSRTVPGPDRYAGVMLIFVAITFIVFLKMGLYGPRASVLNLWELERVVNGMVIASAFFIASLFMLKIEGLSRLVMVCSLLSSLVTVVVVRRLLSVWLRSRRQSEKLGLRVAIVGCGDMGRLLMKKLVDAPHVHRAIVGFLDDDLPRGHLVSCTTDQSTQRLFRRPVLGAPSELRQVAGAHGVQEVLVDSATLPRSVLRDVLRTGRDMGLCVGVVPDFADVGSDELKLEELSAIPVLRPRSPADRHGYRRAKRVLDVVGSILLLVLSAPLAIAAMIALQLSSPASVIFRQTRVGRLGRPFVMYKFRTMVESSEPYDRSPDDDDPRVTRVGRILRITGFDELPQLINVLRGEMSLVGPRPEMPFIVDTYTDVQRRRLAVKPGLTGVWQLSPDRNADIHENIEYDLYYIHHRSLVLDALILTETIFSTIEISIRKFRRRWIHGRKKIEVGTDAVAGAEINAETSKIH